MTETITVIGFLSYLIMNYFCSPLVYQSLLISNNYGYILKSHLAIIAVLHCGLQFSKEKEKAMIVVWVWGSSKGDVIFY